MSENPPPSAAVFDAWYADMQTNPRKDEIQRRHLGLPLGIASTSAFPWDGVGLAVLQLQLATGSTMVDLGCGRGDYGLEVASRTGAKLIGVDFSTEAIRQARQHAERRGIAADFRVGTLDSTGLDDQSIDAILCIEAIQFAASPPAAYAELRRILVPGGRVVLTSWEAVGPGAAELPERLRAVDLGSGLAGAGFVNIVVTERPDWRSLERAMWEEAAALDPAGDPALQSFHDEGVRSLAGWDLLRRVVAHASAP
jgi:SAM-dependent methyltransferase